MSKQLKTFITQTLMFAALTIMGLGVQANQLSSAERVQFQGHSVSMDSHMGSGCADMATSDGAVVGGESSSVDCDMDHADCRSSCANCLAPNDYPAAVGLAESAPSVPSAALAVISANYPIHHPPKFLSSL